MAIKRFSRLGKILIGANPDSEEELFQLEGRVERFTHFWVLVTRQFVRHRCLIRASALAYTTLLALIPLLAVIISVSSSLLKNQGEEQFYEAIASIAPPVTAPAHAAVSVTTNFVAAEVSTNAVAATNAVAGTEVAQPELGVNTQKELARQLRNFVQNSQGATLGVTGMLVFVFIAIMMLSRIEETFNDIWGVARGRSWLWRIVLYWATITLAPLLLLTALGLTSSAHFQAGQDFFRQMPVIGNLIFKLLPLVMLWFAFALIYQIVPNTKVKFSAALAGGLLAGTLWHLNNVFGFIYVSRVVTNSQMYGKLALVPIFMLGLYFSWAILLFGAEIAYAFQNRAAYLQDKLADNVNQRGREFVALRLMTCLGQRFQNALPPPTVSEMSAELAVPSRLTQQVLRTLAVAHLVTEVAGTENAYLPARPLDAISAHDILRALRSGHGQELPLHTEPALAEVYGEFARIEEAERHAASAISLLALVQRLPAGAALAKPASNSNEIAAAPVVEPHLEPEKIEPVPAFAAKGEPQPAPPEIPAAETMARREVVRPADDNDFPL